MGRESFLGQAWDLKTRDAVLKVVGSIKRTNHDIMETSNKKLRIEKDDDNDIDNRISRVESSETSSWANPLYSQLTHSQSESGSGWWQPSLDYRQRYQTLSTSPETSDCHRRNVADQEKLNLARRQKSVIVRNTSFRAKKVVENWDLPNLQHAERLQNLRHIQNEI